MWVIEVMRTIIAAESALADTAPFVSRVAPCCIMCLYAKDVSAATLPGPYTDAKANLFTRASLMPYAEFRLVAHRSDAEIAAYFQVPLEQTPERRLDLFKPQRQL